MAVIIAVIHKLSYEGYLQPFVLWPGPAWPVGAEYVCILTLSHHEINVWLPYSKTNKKIILSFFKLF